MPTVHPPGPPLYPRVFWLACALHFTGAMSHGMLVLLPLFVRMRGGPRVALPGAERARRRAHAGAAARHGGELYTGALDLGGVLGTPLCGAAACALGYRPMFARTATTSLAGLALMARDRWAVPLHGEHAWIASRS